MEDKALETLRTMLSRRGLDTKTERVVAADLDRANLYTIGKMLVVFSQKDKGVLDKDLTTFRKFAEANDYTNGLVVVSLVPPSENVLRSIKAQAADRLQFFHIRQLQFDITTHRMAVPHHIFDQAFRTKYPIIAEKYDELHIEKPEEQLPWIDSQDPPVKWIGAIPGDTICVLRHSDVAGVSPYFRYCVADVNVA
jgi:DNA-directed RNA polymerase subunit H (RpoH/RPB5)